MKERHIVLLVVVMTFVVLGVSMLIPSNRDKMPTTLPWQVQPTANGSISVFGLTLGQSTLNDARRLFREEVEVSLFTSDKGTYEVEAYFDTVDISGLKAKIVMSMLLSEEQRKAMYARGARISNMGGGNRRVSLSEADQRTVLETPIAAITYLPRIKLQEEMILKNFGKPEQRIKEKDKPTVHWLYPERGLDIVQSEKGKDLLQYVMPKRFDSLLQPLLQQGVVVPGELSQP